MAHANMTETAVSPDAGSESLATAPDWEKVPFDVGCARCGNDLRGLSEPKCPACSLEFDWAEAVPIEELTCAHCGYHLYGLAIARCPECGITFDWQEALTRYHRRRLPYFEYRWRDRPVRSFVGTWCRALRPPRFWSTITIHDPPQMWPLLLTALFSWLFFVMTLVLAVSTSECGRYMYIRSMRGAPFAAGVLPVVWLQHLSDTLAYSPTRDVGILYASWLLCGLIALMIFQQSMRRCKVRTAHVLRVWVYSFAMPVVPACLAYFIIRDVLWVNGSVRIGEYVVFWFLLGTASFVAWTTATAYKRYLHMPHAAAVAFSVQLIACLGGLALTDLAFSTGFGPQIAYGLGRCLGAW